MMRLSITTTTTHPRDTCPVCERMAREAEGTALRLGRDKQRTRIRFSGRGAARA